MVLTAWDYSGNGASTALLGSLDDEGETGWVDLAGLSGRVVVSVANGATDPVTFEVQCSHDTAEWATTVLAIDPSDSSEITDRTVLASGYDLLHLDPEAVGRYMRISVTAANAAGTAFTVFAERR